MCINIRHKLLKFFCSFNAISYEITSSDPGTYQRPYTVEMTLDYTEDPIYEYACHEGNYAMANILAGARAEERK